VATWRVVSLGGQVDANLSVSSWEALPQTQIARRTAPKRSRPRMLSGFARGILTLVAALIPGEGLLLGRFVPEPGPWTPPACRKKKTKLTAHTSQEAA
jgi:hypothetical protein